MQMYTQWETARSTQVNYELGRMTNANAIKGNFTSIDVPKLSQN